jgi:hypothetical protein
MQILINTDHNIQGREALAARLSGVVDQALRRVAEHITRVEVHLSIESGGKSGQSDKRCAMEARLEGLQSLTVTDDARDRHQVRSPARQEPARGVAPGRHRGTHGRLIEM